MGRWDEGCDSQNRYPNREGKMKRGDVTAALANLEGLAGAVQALEE